MRVCVSVLSVWMCVVGVAVLEKPVCLAEGRGEVLNLAEGTEYPRCGHGGTPGGDL